MCVSWLGVMFEWVCSCACPSDTMNVFHFPNWWFIRWHVSNWEFSNSTHSSCEVLTAKENSLLIVIKCVGPVLCLCTGWNVYSFRPLCEQCKSEVNLSLWVTSCWTPWCWCKLHVSVMVVVSYWVLIFTCIFKAMHVFWNLNYWNDIIKVYSW